MKLPDFLVDSPDGEVRMTGHRIGLYTVVRRYKEGWTAEQMAEEYPSLPLDLIQNVIAFYLQNREEVDVYVEDYRAELDRQEAAPPSPGLLKLRRQMELIRQADLRHADEPGWSSLSVVEKLERIKKETGIDTV